MVQVQPEKKAFTNPRSGEQGKERQSQLEYIIGPRWKWDETNIYNDEKVWDSWNHHPIYALRYKNMKFRTISLQRDERIFGLDVCQKKTDEQKNEFHKM